MPSEISTMFEACNIGDLYGPISWGQLSSQAGVSQVLSEAGVYVVALPEGPLEKAPFSESAIKEWLYLRPEIRLDGIRPSLDELVGRLSGFWLPDEVILYVGQTTSRTLRHRLQQFYRHRLGDRSPHAGGQWLKTLANLDQLRVFWARSTAPEADEAKLIHQYITNVSSDARRQLHDPEHPFPFANLEFPRGTRKTHELKGMREPRRRQRKG